MSELVFIDTETTGLDETRHEVWEVGAVGLGTYLPGPGKTAEKRYVTQSQWLMPVVHLEYADANALKLNGFYERAPLAVHEDGYERDPLEVRTGKFREIAQLTVGKHLAGFNPAFDARFLAKDMRKAGVAPAWHHRFVDLEAMAMQKFGWDSPRGTDAILDELEIHKRNRHTALGDCVLAVEVYERLRADG